MTERPILFSCPMIRALNEGRKTQTRRVVMLNMSGRVMMKHKQWHPDDPNAVLGCPYGQVGQMIWCKETFALCLEKENHKHAKNGFTYRTDWSVEDDVNFRDFKWKPSIFMPRAASRITLELTAVRIERIQSISEEDARSEGFEKRDHFIQLWDKLNSKRGFGFDINPIVWVISFRKL